MDAFEEVISGLLSQKGYWIARSFKVEITKEEKVAINRASSPRWEIDILAYSGARRELLVVECKSYLDSGGVDINGLKETANPKSRYKLFTDQNLREIVFGRLKIQMLGLGLIPEGTSLKLALAVGKFKNKNSKSEVSELFKRNDWILFDPEWIVAELLKTSETAYFDSVPHIVSKLINRSRII